MIRQLGVTGFLGILVLIAGFAIVAYEAPIIAGGLALILAGVGLVIHAAVRALASRFGMGAMV